MTDKVQKIKEWISKTQDSLMDAQGNFEYSEHEGAYHILCNLESYIDSLQEEPISEDLEEAAEKAAINAFFVSPQWTAVGKELFKDGANWQKKQDQSTIELAEDHAMLAGMEKGYHQAEKDLELTVDDIKNIDKLLNQCVDCNNPYQEVLKRFKAAK